MSAIYDLRIEPNNDNGTNSLNGILYFSGVNINYNLSTSNIKENGNLFYTDSRVNSNINVQKGISAFEWGNHTTSGYATIYQLSSNIITLSGDVTGSGSSGITTTISNNSITNAKFRNSQALSVVGRDVNTIGNIGDILASSNGQVLKRVSNTLGFHSIGIEDLPNSGVSSGTFNYLTVNNKGLVTDASFKNYITGNQTITVTGCYR